MLKGTKHRTSPNCWGTVSCTTESVVNIFPLLFEHRTWFFAEFCPSTIPTKSVSRGLPGFKLVTTFAQSVVSKHDFLPCLLKTQIVIIVVFHLFERKRTPIAVNILESDSRILLLQNRETQCHEYQHISTSKEKKGINKLRLPTSSNNQVHPYISCRVFIWEECHFPEMACLKNLIFQIQDKQTNTNHWSKTRLANCTAPWSGMCVCHSLAARNFSKPRYQHCRVGSKSPASQACHPPESRLETSWDVSSLDMPFNA